MSVALHRSVVLIGYRGSGKTTVGRRLAARLCVPFIDTDTVVADEAGMSIAEIFGAEGEKGFRQRESRAVAGIRFDSPVVVSAGGGMVLLDDAMTTLKSAGHVVWLSAAAAVLAARLAADATMSTARPPLTDLSSQDEVQSVLARREPLYRRWADAEFATDAEPHHRVVERLVEWLRCCENTG